MAKYYRIPLLSRVALWVAHRLIPYRVYAAIQIATYDQIDEYTRKINHHNEDGSIELFDAISRTKIESLRRKLWYNFMKATIEER